MSRLTQTIVTCLCVGLLIFFGKLSLQSGDGQFSEVQSLVYEIDQLNHELDCAVLSLQLGLASDYDELSGLEGRLSATRGRCKQLKSTFHSPSDRWLPLEACVAEKVQLVANFKANHAVVRNSIAGFQRAIARASLVDPKSNRELSKSLVTLQIAGMRYSMTGKLEDRGRLEAELQEFPDIFHYRLSRDTAESIQLACRHGRNLLARRTILNETIAKLVSIPIKPAKAALLSSATDIFLNQTEATNRYRLVFVAILVLLASLKVYHHYSVIHERRVAIESNRVLENRVNQRTAELANANSRLESAMAEAEKLALVAKFTDNGVMITDRRGRVEWVNDGFERITGFGIDDVVGKCTWEFLHGTKTDPAQTQGLQEALREGKRFDGEMVKYRKNGEAFWMAVEFRPIRNSQGEVDRYIVIERDTSERIAAELERQRLSEQLIDASRNAGIAEMATGVLHNVGNVLNSINVSVALIDRNLNHSACQQLERVSGLIGQHLNDFSEFVSEDKRGKRLPEFIVKIADALGEEHRKTKSECKDLIANVEHIKEIVAVQQQSADSAGLVQVVSPKDVLESAIVANKGTLTKHSVFLRTHFEDTLPQLSSDKHKILQILINLIRNAKDAVVEAREVGERRVDIHVNQHGSHVRFGIVDNGVGISNSNLQKIFQHGFTTKKRGHGFGLHSGANAAIELGGKLEVQSDGVGQGTTFVLTLPIDVDAVNSFEVSGENPESSELASV
ncbi:MAG: DAHL domain-containing protein [Pirellulaceae bacterium]